MGINRGRVVHKAKIYAAVFIISMALIVDILLVAQLEVEERKQAVFNAQHTVGCISRVERARGRLDRGVLKTCADDMRTSITGDMFVLDIVTKEFLYDGSDDVPRDRVLYFTEDSVGKYFKDWPSAEVAIASITSGVDSSVAKRVSYNFDGAEEWLEYRSYKSPYRESRIVVVQGVQSDEALSGFAFLRNLARALAGGYAIWLISTALGRRLDDNTRSSTSTS